MDFYLVLTVRKCSHFGVIAFLGSAHGQRQPGKPEERGSFAWWDSSEKSPRPQGSYLDLRSPDASYLDLLVGHQDPETPQPSRPCVRLLLVDVDFQVLWPLRAGLEERVGELDGEGVGGAVKGVQHLVLAEQAHGLPLGEATLVAVLHCAHLLATARLVEAVHVAALLTQALHRAVGRGPEELAHGVVVAVEVTAALVQRNALAGAEDKACVALAALRAGRGAGVGGRQIGARVRAAAGTHGVVAEARALHHGH